MKIGGQIWLYRTTENVRLETWGTGQRAGQGNRGGFAWAIRGFSSVLPGLSGMRPRHGFVPSASSHVGPDSSRLDPGSRLRSPAATCSCNTFMHHHGQSRTLPPELPCGWLNGADDGGASVSFVSSVFRPTLTPAHPPRSCSILPSPSHIRAFVPFSVSEFNFLTFARKPANLLSL